MTKTTRSEIQRRAGTSCSVSVPKKDVANDNARPARRTTRAHRRRPPATARRRSLMREWAPAILATFFGIGCGPTFDPASLVTSTRVVGAQVVAPSEDRASVAPGESADVTWLVTAPGGAASVPATLSWVFALCTPATDGSLGCAGPPLVVFQGTSNPPKTAITMPPADAPAGAQQLTLFGRVCDTGTPAFDATGNPVCSDGAGTTASVEVHVQTADDVNHNPTADHGLSFDGQPWPVTTDPCVDGPRVTADESDHVVELVTTGSDRELYVAVVGDPPKPTPEREALQVSLFTTSGKLKSPFEFVEAADDAPETPVSVGWTAPKAAAVAAPTPVFFTFVVRDGRGGVDWTSRAACAVPAPPR